MAGISPLNHSTENISGLMRVDLFMDSIFASHLWKSKARLDIESCAADTRAYEAGCSPNRHRCNRSRSPLVLNLQKKTSSEKIWVRVSCINAKKLWIKKSALRVYPHLRFLIACSLLFNGTAASISTNLLFVHHGNLSLPL
ncbi:MAG: hypothetical protein ACJASY_003425 [Halioglobus sp.]|jgi:hypothetical protein